VRTAGLWGLEVGAAIVALMWLSVGYHRGRADETFASSIGLSVSECVSTAQTEGRALQGVAESMCNYRLPKKR
jgi:hypothetical protein